MTRYPRFSPALVWGLHGDGMELVWAHEGSILAWHWKGQWPCGLEGRC